jgi:hypothetical protein
MRQVVDIVFGDSISLAWRKEKILGHAVLGRAHSRVKDFHDDADSK